MLKYCLILAIILALLYAYPAFKPTPEKEVWYDAPEEPEAH